MINYERRIDLILWWQLMDEKNEQSKVKMGLN